MTPRDPASPAEQVRAIAEKLDDEYESCGPGRRHLWAEQLRAAAARLDALEQVQRDLELMTLARDIHIHLNNTMSAKLAELEARPRQVAHSKSEYKRVKAMGGDIDPPSPPAAPAAPTDPQAERDRLEAEASDELSAHGHRAGGFTACTCERCDVSRGVLALLADVRRLEGERDRIEDTCIRFRSWLDHAGRIRDFHVSHVIGKVDELNMPADSDRQARVKGTR